MWTLSFWQRTLGAAMLALLLTLTVSQADGKVPFADEPPETEASQPLDDGGDTRPQPNQDRQKAAEYYSRGLELFDQGAYAGALEAFKSAEHFFHSPINVYNIATCHEKLANAAECVQWYERYLEDYKKAEGEAPPDEENVRLSIAKCRLGLNSDVTVESIPPNANVALDGRGGALLGQTPWTSQLPPGAHTIYLTLDGYEPMQVQVEARAGEPLTLVLRLKPIDTSSVIRVNANIVGATIFIDGQNVGLTPYEQDIRVDAGVHQVVIKKDDYITHSQQIDTNEPSELVVAADLFLKNPPVTWKKGVGIASLVLGVLGLGGGVAYGQFYPEIHGRAFYEDTEDFQSVQLAEQLMIGFGAAFTAAGLTLIIVEAVGTSTIKEEDRHVSSFNDGDGLDWQLSITPTATGGYAGMSVRF